MSIPTQGVPLVVRMADFTGNGVDDIAVLTTTGLTVYLGDGRGACCRRRPTRGRRADGLTVADVNHDGKLDLLVGDTYGDVLVLLGDGAGASPRTTMPTSPSSWPWPT